MENHIYSAKAVVDSANNHVHIEITCETENRTNRVPDIPLSEVGAFVDAGFMGVLLGQVPENLYQAVVAALTDAGLDINEGYSLN